jgi:hypothetical protein
MAKKVIKPEEIENIETTEEVFNWFQACNHLQVNGINRKVVQRLYSKDMKTAIEWQDLLKRNNLCN